MDQAMLEHVLANPGITDRELGERVGLKRGQTNLRRRNPIFRARLLELRQQSQKDAISLVQQYQALAVQVIASQMGLDQSRHADDKRAPIEAVRQRAAFWIGKDLNKEAAKRATPKHDEQDAGTLSRDELEGFAGLATEIAKRKAEDA